jgi:hypothetical protein
VGQNIGDIFEALRHLFQDILESWIINCCPQVMIGIVAVEIIVFCGGQRWFMLCKIHFDLSGFRAQIHG